MYSTDKISNTAAVVQKALSLGFFDIRFAKAEHMDEEARRLELWLSNGFHGEMEYMSNHFDLRIDPAKLVPGAKTVICLSYNYFTTAKQKDPEAPKISMYAQGRDYHKVVKKKLREMEKWMTQSFVDCAVRSFVDSGPVLERDWARRSGLGWIGKNTMLINPKKGSYFFLAVIICDLEFVYDKPIKDYCGTCRKCIDACPTEAISPEGYLMDGSKCISYLTIELKKAIPEEFKGKMENWMFGCDICQDVCPWNRFSKPHQEVDFIAKPPLMEMTKKDWEELTEATFEEIFAGSAVRRTKFEGLKRNISFLG